MQTIYRPQEPRKINTTYVPFGGNDGGDEEGQAEEAVHPVLGGGFVGPGGRPGGVRGGTSIVGGRRGVVGRQRPVGRGQRGGKDLGHLPCVVGTKAKAKAKEFSII